MRERPPGKITLILIDGVCNACHFCSVVKIFLVFHDTLFLFSLPATQILLSLVYLQPYSQFSWVCLQPYFLYGQTVIIFSPSIF